MAQKENEGTQSYKFWNTKKWKKTFSFQVILANRLAAKYPCAAIVKAVNSRELKNVYSLRYPNIEDVIEKYEKIIESEKKDVTIIDIQEEPKSRSSSYGKKSSLQRLRNIDGKEENKK
jgi:endo-1,4-beta-mannosidase